MHAHNAVALLLLRDKLGFAGPCPVWLVVRARLDIPWIGGNGNLTCKARADHHSTSFRPSVSLPFLACRAHRRLPTAASKNITSILWECERIPCADKNHHSKPAPAILHYHSPPSPRSHLHRRYPPPPRPLCQLTLLARPFYLARQSVPITVLTPSGHTLHSRHTSPHNTAPTAAYTGKHSPPPT